MHDQTLTPVGENFMRRRLRPYDNTLTILILNRVRTCIACAFNGRIWGRKQ